MVVRRSIRCNRAFTLVELMVVMVVIGILIALLLPAVQSARHAALRMQCANNLKQLGLAFQTYHDTHKVFPPGWIISGFDMSVPTAENVWFSTWGVMVLPFMEQRPLYDRWNMPVPNVSNATLGLYWTKDIDSLADSNVSLSRTVIDVFACPTAPDAKARVYTTTFGAGTIEIDRTPTGWLPGEAIHLSSAPSDYTVITGAAENLKELADAAYDTDSDFEGPLQPDTPARHSHRRLTDIRDGASNTILLAERAGGPNIYTRGGKLNMVMTFSFGSDNGGGWADIYNGENWLGGAPRNGVYTTPVYGMCMINCNNHREHSLFSFHPGGINVVRCDGSVTFVSETIQPAVLAAAISCNQGEVFEWP